MKKFLLPALISIALTMPAAGQDRPSANLYGTGEYTSLVSEHPVQGFATLADAMKRLPEMPTVKQIITPAAKREADAMIYTSYNRAIEQSTLTYKDQTAIRARLDAARRKQAQRGQQAMQQYEKNVQAGLMPSQEEMMQILMSSGIDLEKANEQQIMDAVCTAIAQKWGVSKDECLKILNLAQRNPNQAEAYMKSKHPDLYQRLYATNADSQVHELSDDPRDKRFMQIGAELQTLQEQLTNATASYKNEAERIQRAAQAAQAGDDQPHFANSALVGDKVVQLADQLYKEWLDSREAKQIDDIEYALWKRVEEWTAGLSGNSEIPYPEWWTAERKKENVLIDTWNRRAAQRWLEVTGAHQQELKAIFTRAAELETENEQLSQQGDTENVQYLMNKQHLLLFYNQLLNIMTPYRDALLFPCVEQQEETGSVHQGKG